MRPLIALRTIIVWCIICFPFLLIAQEESRAGKINGVSIWSDSTSRTVEDFNFLEGSNASWVAFHPLGLVNDSEVGVEFDYTGTWECSSFDGLANNIRISKELGYMVFIKPHLLLKYTTSGAWVGDLKLSNNSSENAFRETYLNYIIELAKLCDSLEVEMLSLGTEMTKFVEDNPGYWQELIDSTTANYYGLITFSANFDAYQKYFYWDQMDIIGIDAYFTLNKSENADLNACREDWIPIAETIEQFSKACKKPVLFTEYGYMSADKCAYRPFEQQSANVNLVAQANAYRALFDTFWHEPWFGGGFSWIWGYDNTLPENYDNVGYSPQNKPAQNIISKYYKIYR